MLATQLKRLSLSGKAETVESPDICNENSTCHVSRLGKGKEKVQVLLTIFHCENEGYRSIISTF